LINISEHYWSFDP